MKLSRRANHMTLHPGLSRRYRTPCGRRAFTLIELLVVITIVLILSAVTIASYNYSVNADRVRSAARQFQSFIAGARDKAIYANDVRGVRLILDPNDNHAVSGMLYVGAPQVETGVLTFNPISNNPPYVINPPTWSPPFDSSGRTVIWNSGTLWSSLQRRGLLRVGSRIQIPAASGAWYTISAISIASGISEPVLTLNIPNTDLANSFGLVTYNLELAPTILGDAQPVLFPRGVVIDLDGSQLPTFWRATSLTYPISSANSSYFPQMDILFTPRGTVVGDAAAMGMLHFHFAEAFDVANWHTSTNANWSRTNSTTSTYSRAALPQVPADAAGAVPPLVVTRNRILATLTPRTGNVSVHYVNTTVVGPGFTTSVSNSLATDPFLFAETGQVANK